MTLEFSFVRGVFFCCFIEWLIVIYDVWTFKDSFTRLRTAWVVWVSTAFREFDFSSMSEDVVLDGVNVMSKNVWTNETWLDRCILTLVFCFKIVLQKLTFRSFFSAVLKGWLLHAMIRDLERYLREWNMIRSLYRGRRVVPGVWFSFLFLNCVFLLPFMVFGLLTIRSHGWGLPQSFECRLLFREFHFYLCLKKLCWKVWTWCAKISGPLKLDSIILHGPGIVRRVWF